MSSSKVNTSAITAKVLQSARQICKVSSSNAKKQKIHWTTIRETSYNTNAVLDTQDPCDAGLKQAMEELSNDQITVCVISNHVSTKKVQKKCAQTRDRPERKELVGYADNVDFVEIDWETALSERWFECVENCSTQYLLVLQPWTGEIKVKNSKDLHCRFIGMIADVHWIPRFATHFMYDINDEIMGGVHSMQLFCHLLYLTLVIFNKT